MSRANPGFALGYTGFTLLITILNRALYPARAVFKVEPSSMS